MELLAAIGEEHVHAAWLAAELDSERFAKDVHAGLEAAGAGERLVTEPDLADPEQNRLRREILYAYRGGYVGRSLDGLAWHRAAFGPDEVLSILYIDWDYWNDVSGGSRLASDAVPRLRSRGAEPGYATVAARDAHPPLIAVRAAPGERIVLVEGHVRLTAYAFFPERIPRPLEVLLGEGEGVRRFGCY